MNIRPLRDWILVRRFPTESETRGGILLPDQAKAKPQRGVVVRLGEGVPIKRPRDTEDKGLGSLHPNSRLFAPFQVAVGDTVYFNFYGGAHDMPLGEDRLMLIREEEILMSTPKEDDHGGV